MSVFPDSVVIGQGEHCYRYERQWAKLPRWWTFGSTEPNVRPPRTAVKGAVASNGDVYVLSRSAHPVCIFDQAGQFVSAWGEGAFSPLVHGLSIADDGSVWITDSGTHQITIHEPSGREIGTLGRRGQPTPTLNGTPFNMPTGVAFAPNSDVYVSDGYGNRRVHRFAPDLTLQHSWGEPGIGPGQFATVHFVTVDAHGQVYITDRGNHRIQIFDGAGAFLSEWTGFDMPSDIAIGRGTIYVGGRDGLSLWTLDRTPIMHWGADEPAPGAFRIHGLWIDAAENIYLAQFDRAVSKLTRITST